VNPRFLWVLALAGLAACGGAPSRRASVPRKPLAAAELVPVDLDFVVRIDTERLRAGVAFPAVREELDRHQGSGLFRALRPHLEHSRSILVGGRIFAGGFQGDGVLVIEGRGEQTAAVDPPFARIASPRPDVELFERPSGERGEPILQAWSQSGAIALATVAEADALLRIVREGPDRERLQPHAHGVISFAGRGSGDFGPSGDPGKSPTTLGSPRRGTGDNGGKKGWRELLRGLERYEGSLELNDGFDADIDVLYATRDQMMRAHELAESIVARLREGKGPLGTLAESIRLAPRDRSVGVRFKVPLEILAALEAGEPR
jgi:hypothetical protein